MFPLNKVKSSKDAWIYVDLDFQLGIEIFQICRMQKSKCVSDFWWGRVNIWANCLFLRHLINNPLSPFPHGAVRGMFTKLWGFRTGTEFKGPTILLPTECQHFLQPCWQEPLKTAEIISGMRSLLLCKRADSDVVQQLLLKISLHVYPFLSTNIY